MRRRAPQRSRRGRGGACAALACVAWILTSGAAWAQPQKKPAGKLDPKMAEAKRLFDDGADLYARGSYEEAIDAWEKSYEISKKPLIFESIANAYERLGQPRKAREYLARWREAAPPDEHDLLDTRLKKLDERIGREDTAAEARKAEEAKAQKEAKPASESAAPKTEESPPPSAGSSARTVGFVLAGAGLGAVAVGVTLDIVAAARRPDPAEACKHSGPRVVCSSTAKDGIESSNRLAVIGDIIWIAGSVMVAGGAVLVLTQRTDGPDKAASAWVAPMVTTRGGGVALDGRF